mgnify:CR=1 FL=1
MLILALESSCDETAASVVENGRIVHSDVVCSQVDLHAKWGGVVPEIASRNHLIEVIPVVDEALARANVSWTDIDAIAVTQGPGLVGALLVGLQVAKSLAMVHNKPLIPVHHLRGHLSAIALHGVDESPGEVPPLPHLALVVSGGHTAIYRVDSYQDISMLANTQDDAVGEALDKGAKLLGIAYPGGAQLEQFATQGDSTAFKFPRAFQGKEESDFSFSGLKTSLLYRLQKMSEEEIQDRYLDLCASYQEAAVDQLSKKCRNFLRKKPYRSFGLSGGVANNQVLRNRLQEVCKDQDINFYAAEKKYTGDNAAMIAFATFIDRNGLWSNENGQLNFNPSLMIDSLPIPL